MTMLKHLLQFATPTFAITGVIVFCFCVLPPLAGKTFVPGTSYGVPAILFALLSVTLCCHDRLCKCRQRIPYSVHIAWASAVLALLFILQTGRYPC